MLRLDGIGNGSIKAQNQGRRSLPPQRCLGLFSKLEVACNGAGCWRFTLSCHTENPPTIKNASYHRCWHFLKCSHTKSVLTTARWAQRACSSSCCDCLHSRSAMFRSVMALRRAWRNGLSASGLEPSISGSCSHAAAVRPFQSMMSGNCGSDNQQRVQCEADACECVCPSADGYQHMSDGER